MIIGISGPAGAGKDTAASYIEKEFGFTHVSGGDVLRGLLRQIGFEPKKEAVGDLGTLLRNNYGGDAILKLVMDQGGSNDIIISGFRSPEEARLIQEYGGAVLYIDAPKDIRHRRILERSRDGESAATIIAMDKKEAHSQNKLGESLTDVRQIANYVICNDNSVEDLYMKVREVFSRLDSISS